MFPVTIIAPSQETELFLNNRGLFTKPIDEKKIKLHFMSSPNAYLFKKQKMRFDSLGSIDSLYYM